MCPNWHVATSLCRTTHTNVVCNQYLGDKLVIVRNKCQTKWSCLILPDDDTLFMGEEFPNYFTKISLNNFNGPEKISTKGKLFLKNQNIFSKMK